jgi:hypothetical protein
MFAHPIHLFPNRHTKRSPQQKRSSRSRNHFSEIRVTVVKHLKHRNHRLPVHDFIRSPKVDSPIDYSDFIPLDLTSGDKWSALDGLYLGILHYIFFHSKNHYNSAELSIECSEIQPNSDPTNIFSFDSPEILELGDGPGHCIVITFRRIAVRPSLLLLSFPKPDQITRPPKCYVFEGWNIRRKKWIILTERSEFSGCRFGVMLCVDRIDTEMEYSKFRLRHTDTNFSRTRHIGINGIEIHGHVNVIEPEISQCQEIGAAVKDFDPWAIHDWI